MNGGLNYTDAIDNSAGVGTSDHEVNIKILTSSLLQNGDMTIKQRDTLLASVTDDVGHRVLVDNYQQTQAVSLETAYGKELLNAHAQLIRFLEAKGGLDRAVEFLPDEKHLTERARMGRGLTAPEVAVLLAYAKISLKQAILETRLPDGPIFQKLLVNYFPDAVAEKCAEQIPSHPLRREIITTKIVSRLVNRMGTTFTRRIGEETGADLQPVISAWYAASELLDAESLWKEIEALDLKIPSARQMALMMALRALVGAATRQVLASQMADAGISEIIDAYRDALAQAVATARAGKEGEAAIAALLDAQPVIVGVFERVDLARSSHRPLEEIAATCARLDASLDLAWIANAIGNLPAANRWQARARAQLADDLRVLRRSLLQRDIADDAAAAARNVVEELRRNAPQDLAMLSAGLSEIRCLFDI
jgi:glutamate dehydrogenase